MSVLRSLYFFVFLAIYASPNGSSSGSALSSSESADIDKNSNHDLDNIADSAPNEVDDNVPDISTTPQAQGTDTNVGGDNNDSGMTTTDKSEQEETTKASPKPTGISSTTTTIKTKRPSQAPSPKPTEITLQTTDRELPDPTTTDADSIACGDSHQPCCTAGPDGCHIDGEICFQPSVGFEPALCRNPNESEEGTRCGLLAQRCCLGTLQDTQCATSSDLPLICTVMDATGFFLCILVDTDTERHSLICGAQSESCCPATEGAAACDSGLVCSRNALDMYTCVDPAGTSHHEANEKYADDREYGVGEEDEHMATTTTAMNTVLLVLCLGVAVVGSVAMVAVLLYYGKCLQYESRSRIISGHVAVENHDLDEEEEQEEEATAHRIVGGEESETEIINIQREW